MLCDTILDYSDSLAVSGYEKDFLGRIKASLKILDIPSDFDSFGNLLVRYICPSSDESMVVFSAHADEVGFQVQKAVGRQIYFRVLGALTTFGLVNKRVRIGKLSTGEIISSVPEIQLEKNSIEKLFIQIDENSPSPEIGDVGSFDSRCLVENQSRIKGKALDNRVGCALLFELLVRLFKEKPIVKHAFCFVFTREEEMGGRGIQHFSYVHRPDFVIALDATPVNEKNNIEIGNGPCIKISDGSSISDSGLIAEFKNVAKKNAIAYQLEVNDLGFSESAFPPLVSDAKCVTISYPLLGIHSAYSKVSIEDVENTLRLLNLFIREF